MRPAIIFPLALLRLAGSVAAFKPGFRFEELARNVVERTLRANPVFEGRRMYLRAPGKLYCFGE